jgi:hypothetical protein
VGRTSTAGAKLDPVLLASYLASGGRIGRRALLGHRRHPGDARQVVRAVLAACWDVDHYDASAGHFRQFWTRDLGFSAGPLVRLGYRERVRASLAWALDAWAAGGRVTTTIFPGRRPRDVYLLGIDSLPLLLHALRTVDGADLLSSHGSWLRREVIRYADAAIDPRTGLARPGRRYSTHRDTVRTGSNCYANTMLALLSRTLGETSWFPDPVPPGASRRLVDVHWRGDRFVDDPATGEVTGDAIVFPFWLDVVPPGAGLAPALAAADRVGLTTPLPLRYATVRHAAAEDPLQRLFVPDYQGSSIWTSLGAIYLSLLDGLDPVAATPGVDAYARLIERDGTYWEVLAGDLRPYRGRLGIFRADEGMLWSAIFLDVLERRRRRSGEPGGAPQGDERDGGDQPEEQVPAPGDEGDARPHGQPLDPDVEGRGRLTGDRQADGGERGEHGRPDEPQVLERTSRQPVEAGRQERQRPGGIGDGAHEEREGDELEAHRRRSAPAGRSSSPASMVKA